jgi:hypothetical protein
VVARLFERLGHRQQLSDPDTARMPDSGPTVASRTCMVVGRILERAAARLRKELGPYKSPKEFTKRARFVLADRGKLEIIEEYQKPGEIEWSDETYKGDAYGAYGLEWNADIGRRVSRSLRDGGLAEFHREQLRIIMV